MQRRVIGVRFLEDSSRYAPKISCEERGGRAYSYYCDDDTVVEGDIVIVRTYDIKNGPFRFAKVVTTANVSHSAQTKTIVAKLDLEAYYEAEQRTEREAQAREVLRKAASRRSEAELFEQVKDNLTAEELALVATSLGYSVSKPAEDKPLKSYVVTYVDRHYRLDASSADSALALVAKLWDRDIASLTVRLA